MFFQIFPWYFQYFHELFVGYAQTIFDCSRWIQPLNLLAELYFLGLYIVFSCIVGNLFSIISRKRIMSWALRRSFYILYHLQLFVLRTVKLIFWKKNQFSGLRLKLLIELIYSYWITPFPLTIIFKTCLFSESLNVFHVREK